MHTPAGLSWWLRKENQLLKTWWLALATWGEHTKQNLVKNYTIIQRYTLGQLAL